MRTKGIRYGGQSGHTADDLWKQREESYSKQAKDDTALWAWLEAHNLVAAPGRSPSAAAVRRFNAAMKGAK